MTTEQIDFYILENSEHIKTTCRLLEKAYLEQYRIFVLCENEEMVEQLDSALWTFRDISFVPHHRLQDVDNASSPICLHHKYVNNSHQDLLVLLKDHLPDEYTLFKRIAIIVPNDETKKKKARELYKQLQKTSIALNVHKIG